MVPVISSDFRRERPKSQSFTSQGRAAEEPRILKRGGNEKPFLSLFFGGVFSFFCFLRHAFVCLRCFFGDVSCFYDGCHGFWHAVHVLCKKRPVSHVSCFGVFLSRLLVIPKPPPTCFSWLPGFWKNTRWWGVLMDVKQFRGNSSGLLLRRPVKSLKQIGRRSAKFRRS